MGEMLRRVPEEDTTVWKARIGRRSMGCDGQDSVRCVCVHVHVCASMCVCVC